VNAGSAGAGYPVSEESAVDPIWLDPARRTKFMLRTRWRIRLLPRGDTRIISLRVRRGREESNTSLSLIIYFILRL